MSVFWQRVYQFFVDDFGASTCRDGKKLQTHRWSKHLLPMLNKFGVILQQLENNKPSGMSDKMCMMKLAVLS
ncbi:hypothetical protein AQUCO_06000065v1 [Aquilegia coerulea]|uniref:Uncharacterized protein n=1 Tax=Aquilegia coerulea TaxID=218851 RepID=A0A2G5CF41_AQUCA|nr:hypothetical protein AQUCO_06000065v1 [Aquilegia coerulea]